MLKPQKETIVVKQEENCLQATSEAKISDDPDFEAQENYSQEVQEQRQNLKVNPKHNFLSQSTHYHLSYLIQPLNYMG